MENDIFYCYSKRMNYFLMSMKFRYLSKGINSVSEKEYWTYKKSKKLDLAIQKYNSIKHNYN